MKKNISLVFLVLEIATIVVLHAVKMNQQNQHQNMATDNIISKTTVVDPLAKHYTLLSIK
jgi:hypothetical protein